MITEILFILWNKC